MSDAFEEAVLCRASGDGLVPIGIIRKLTASEWSRIWIMGQSEARRLLRASETEPVIIIERDHGR